jgi:polysaccharide biosynthesis/export protein
MSVRSIAFLVIVQLTLSFVTAGAAGRKPAPAPAIEMSESADPASVQDEVPAAAAEPVVVPAPSAAVDAPDPDAEPADPDEQPEAPEAVGEAAASSPQSAAVAPSPQSEASAPAGAAVPRAAVLEAAAPVAPPTDPVPWWREAASFLGLAPDPHPGETAETAPGRPATAPDYIIGAGDVLGISVWRDENLTRSVVVLPDGKIAFPLVGDLVAGGKTLAQLKGELERKLTRYITDAGLTVEVKQSNSMIVYIIGRVNVPGRQMMVATTNVLQGLAMAGGLNPFAHRSEVKVFRKQGEKTSVFSFNYDDVAEGRHLESNIDLQKGDVILVP